MTSKMRFMMMYDLKEETYIYLKSLLLCLPPIRKLSYKKIQKHIAYSFQKIYICIDAKIGIKIYNYLI